MVQERTKKRGRAPGAKVLGFSGWLLDHWPAGAEQFRKALIRLSETHCDGEEPPQVGTIEGWMKGRPIGWLRFLVSIARKQNHERAWASFLELALKEKGPEIHQQAKAETHPVELDLEWLAEARRKRPSRILRPERPVFLVETSVLMDRFASADRLFQRARCGEEPWELMFRAVKNIEAWFKEQLPSKNDWAIQSSPKAPEPQISYRLEQYAEVESRLWDMLNVTDALCKDHAVTQEQKALYFKFTKTIKSIGRMHEAMLPGAGSANVICGSPQLYLRMRNYAPNAALSIILQMREDEAQSGNLRG